MSRIYFHSETETVEVLGSERAWLGSLVDDIGLATLNAHGIRRMSEWLTFDNFGRGIKPGVTNDQLQASVKLSLRHGGSMDRPDMAYRGQALTPLDITLNTAMRLGSTPVKLAARIHSQCEIHGWVDGPNRAWLAGIIAEGLKTGVFRSPTPDYDPGWRGVIDFLTAKDDGPVVMSYSVCNSFPNAEAADYMPPWPDGVPKDWSALTEEQQAERRHLSDAWYDLSAEDQWRRGMDYLRSVTGLRELEPEGFDDYSFGLNGLTWLDLEAGEARFREVLELVDA